MAICKLCSSIPLDGDGIPKLPQDLWGIRTTWKYIHQFHHRFSKSPAIGFPFHPNLESLKNSAEECDLCQLILISIDKAIAELQNPNPENVRRGDVDIPTKPTWELWLTKRRDLGDGFCVFTNCEGSKDFCLVAAVGVCVNEGDPLQSVYAGRPIQEDPTSPEATEIVMKWMKQCNEHANCTGELPPLPARVVDIGNEDNNGHIRLIETEGQTGKYISLSHCWGKAKQFTTTKASFAHHQAKIDHEHLPKSFKDAIAITRLLGVRYIWIDSICICQDDGEDWERESSKMTSIYMNSYLTIAASAAIDSSIGCFTPRRPPKYISIQYTSKQGTSGEIQAFLLPMRKEALPDLYIDMADNIGEVDHPLSTRAWAVQERVLPRRTLHFGKHQMYFECNEGFKGENGLHVPWRYHTIHSRQRNQFGLVMEEDKNTTIDLWRSLLWDYGSRNLTEPSDKLPAISGIARIIAEQLDDAYIAGMWRKSLLEDLLWQGLGVHRVSKYRAPSWSWASVDGTPAGGIYGKWEPVAEIIDHKVNLKGENIFGEVESGWIKIKAPLVRLILDPRVDPEGTGVPYDNNPKVKTEKGNHEGTYSRFDFGFSTSTGREQGVAMVESLKGVDIFALILVKKLPKSEDGEAYYCALIVRPAEGEDGAMQRVGFLDLDLDDLGECSQLENSEERPIVTLV